MARVLGHAVAACLLVVYLAPVNPVLEASVGARRLHIGRGAVAAGRAHSVIATPEGRVSAWGSGRRGQIGDGALVDRWSPTPVPGMENIVAVTAGSAHTVAVTSDGAVYAWGANSFGRLGDGTRKRRVTPVRVRGLTNVTMVAAGRAHTLALTADGRVFAWGMNAEGQLGVGNRTMSVVPVHVRDLSDVVSIAAGDWHSLAVTRNGRLFVWGSDRFSMLGDDSTKDRLRPFAIALSDVASAAAGEGHSLALLRNGSVYSWGRGAHGELGTGSIRIAPKPVLIPGLKATAIAAGRRFAAAIREDGNVVAWGDNESGQLGDRTTTRRLRPVVVSGVSSAAALALGDAHAIAVTSSGDVRTWGAGDSGQLGNGTVRDRLVPSEIISDIPDWGVGPGEIEEPRDTVPPSITASATPPLQAGWMTTPVTVTFQCSDNVAIALCPPPVTIASDGYAQRVSGTAVDIAGNQATASVVVSLDLTAPELAITAPLNQSAIEADLVEVIGTAFDRASGLSDGRCNGEPAEIVDGTVRCSIQLHPGRNDIVLHAIDVVGHNASASISVMRVGTATTLTLTPSRRAMVVSEEARLSLRDEFGASVEDAVWSSSDDQIVSLSQDTPPSLTAVGVGTATITAAKGGMTATASIDVMASMAPGTTRWTLPPVPGLQSGTPLFANRVDASSPHLFTIDSRNGEDATVRAVTTDGEFLWEQYVPGIPLMGDSFGGVVAGIYDVEQEIRAYARIGDGGARPWRYQSHGRLGSPAQAHDGTIYAIESLFGGFTSLGQDIWDKYAIVIDGATGGLISRTPLLREVAAFTAKLDGMVIGTDPPVLCRSWNDGIPPETVGPVVGSDGRAYLVVRRHVLQMQGDCLPPFRRNPDRTIEMGIDLVILSRDAAPRTVNIYSNTCTGAAGTILPCDLPVLPVQLMPDGIGGTVVTWERGTQMVGQSVFVQRSMTRVTAEEALEERPVAPQFWLELMGQAGMALTYDAGWKEMDITTGNIMPTGPLPELPVLAARPDGGLATLDMSSGELKITGANGDVESTQPFGLDWNAKQLSGDWIGLRDGAVTAVVGDFPDATRFAALRGNAQNQLSLRRPGVGISLKSQKAKEPFPIFHTAIKIAPINQTWLEGWYAAHPQFLPLRDLFGNLYIMLGAGLPNGQDTASNCFIPGADRLVSDTNRAGDVDKIAYGRSELPVSERNEAAAISRLLDWHERYTDNAPYACFPEDLVGFYNSNSYVHSLLMHAAVPHDEKQPRSPSPGWKTQLPATFFPLR